MSRFFQAGGFSSDSSSDSEDESLSSNSDLEKELKKTTTSDCSDESSDKSSSSDSESDQESTSRKGGARSRYLAGASSESSSSDSEDEKRVVKSAKDKRLEEIENCSRAIENAKKINDWVQIFSEFDKLNKAAQKFIQAKVIPPIYIKTIAELEDFFLEAQQKEKEAKKKKSGSNLKAYNFLRQRIRKNNRLFEDEIRVFREYPMLESATDGQAEEGDSEGEKLASEKDGKSRFSSYLQNEVSGSDDQEGFSTIGKGGKVDKFTPVDIAKALAQLKDSRGKKNTDRADQIKTLEKLYEMAFVPQQSLLVLIAMISNRFDFPTGISQYMPLEQWLATKSDIINLLKVVENNHNFHVVADTEEVGETFLRNLEEDENLKIRGSIASFVERLDDELTRALQNIDPHSIEYIDRLKYEIDLYAVLCRAQVYYERVSDGESLQRLILRRLEHLYYKPNVVIEAYEKQAAESIPENVYSKIHKYSDNFSADECIRALATQLYTSENGLLRTRAILCEIYHHSLIDEFYKARDLLLMSHLQENIHQADIGTQILHNRAMVQLGLSAFRNGLIPAAQAALHEICTTGRLRELLAQGVQQQRFSTIKPEQERLEKQRQQPFHMHINIELIEAVYLTSSMLLEIPAIAQSGSFSMESKRKTVSKMFRRLFDLNERQIFQGPPETMRDHVIQAAKNIASGQWQKSRDIIQSISIWELFHNADSVKKMLEVHIQEAGLRTYLFTYAPYYNTMSIQKLSQMFELSPHKVTALVSKMVATEDVNAALDQVHDCIVFEKIEISRFRSLAFSLAEKSSYLLENNQKMIDQKQSINGLGATTDNRRSNLSNQNRNTNYNTKINSKVNSAFRNKFDSMQFNQISSV